jgi:hypothetical protein
MRELAPTPGDDAPTGKTAPPPPPPPLARKLLRYILGFGVSFSIGLAPYLGTFNIPGFTPLLSLIPKSVQPTAIPLAAILMGLVAIVIQWYGGEKVEPKWLKRAFLATLAFTLISFFALFIVHTLVVVRVDFSGGKDYENFLVGFTRPVRPPCTENISNSECIKLLTFNPSAIESYWGDRQIQVAKLALICSYLLFMSSFGLIVGLLLLRDQTPPNPADNLHKVQAPIV